jgi:hypothetical protein
MTVAISAVLSNKPVTAGVEGTFLEMIENIKLSGEYKTGGDSSLTAILEAYFKQEGVGEIRWVNVSGVPGYVFVWNYETNKLQVFESGKEKKPLSELPEAEYPEAIRNATVRMYAIGK